MILYPETIIDKLEFDKILQLAVNNCKSPRGKEYALAVDFSTDYDEICTRLSKVHDYKKILSGGSYFPNDFIQNLEREIALLHIENAVLAEAQLMMVLKLTGSAEAIFRFFKGNEKVYPALEGVLEDSYYEKAIAALITGVLDEYGKVKDNASRELQEIRTKLSRRRQELNRVFARIVQKMQKDGLLADIEQSFINGRKMIVVQSEYKRQLGGIIHGESSSGQSTFIEPKETVELNNDIFELERDEEREVYRILRQLTADLSVYKHLVKRYYDICGEFDLVQAKARLAEDMNASYVQVNRKPVVRLVKAVHPLLYLYNKRAQKPTVPLNVVLNHEQRILVISGPNAGGKTVCLKTVMLLQMMLQSGFLVPASEQSEMGIFKAIMIDIGDAQSIEYELSTYSSHLKTLKHFIDYSDGNTLFCIDELGTGTDPALGGAFAEVVLEELARLKAYGVVTTHYLNLKVMANKVKGITNGAMMFDEENLQPLYQLSLGKPGSSYTFSIAKRSGLPERLIEKAKSMVDEDHYQFDDLLLKIEQLQQREKVLLEEMEVTKKQVNKEREKYNELATRHQRQTQQVQQVQQKKKESPFVREAEKELRRMLVEWNKNKPTEEMAKKTNALLEKLKPVEKPKPAETPQQKEAAKNQQVQVSRKPVKQGSKVQVKNFAKHGVVSSINGKKAIVIIDAVKLNVAVADLTSID